MRKSAASAPSDRAAVILAPALFALGTLAASAQHEPEAPETGTVIVRVVDPHGGPVPEFTIRLWKNWWSSG